MAESSITADFDFISYKIDSISMNMKNNIDYLMNINPINQDSIHLSVRLRNTEKFNINDTITYIGGLKTQIEITEKVNGPIILEGQFGITGLFTSKGTVEKQIEDNFAIVTLPALLLPYLRATMTNILSNAGFGTILFPLLNVYELAKMRNLSIIDHTLENSNAENKLLG